MTQNETFQEIKDITKKLVELGLSIQQNFPIQTGDSIICKAGATQSATLKSVAYKDKYNILTQERNYNFKLVDGALVQLLYRFDKVGRSICAHRLLFFPAPHLENYEDNPESYEGEYFGNSEFHDILEQNVIKTPFRFDFNSSDRIHQSIHHPYSHFHLGEYEKCRIPVKGPLPPGFFLNFILRNFYNSALRDRCNDYYFPTKKKFNDTITTDELLLLHLSN